MTALTWDLLDRRILAAIDFMDVLGRPVTSPVKVVAPEGVRTFVKRPGALIVTEAPGLAAHSAAFDLPPSAPPAGSVRLAIDLIPADRSLAARRFELRLPRDSGVNAQASIFRPVQVVFLPTPAAPVGGLTAALRVGVTRSDDNRLVEGALVRLRPSGGHPQAVALTDAGGEALLLVPAIPIANPGPGAVMVNDIAADLDAIVDPALARFHAAADVMAARRAAERRISGFIDPDDLETRLAAAATASQIVRIAAGRTRSAAIRWDPT